ncbi:ABC transporter ATP-binding protein [Paenibacillus glycinis]|uniref:ATP-binding cassette domain-containing protein n=1 Tax=Paenibacillus glycinis TaxID=2697035 RepID=A0ABW9XK45_9BACL|nr:ABC transporter ATP-binding protein [Paenibacillus glycinis]NBD22981.1 ATP-binding cassette domain-containing protein [Paenibacillus glycinis]
MSLLEVTDLQVEYASPRGAFKAVDGVSFSIERGEIFGLAGESGCGKSTTAFGISRLLRPPARLAGGRVLFDGQELTGMPELAFQAFRWSRMSVVLQSAMNNLNPVMRVGSQLTDVILAHEPGTSARDAWSRAESLLALVELPADRLRSYPHELSGGMRQRVVIAMSLALRPDLIIMDEPTTALDVVTQQGIVRRIVELKKELGFAVLFITHDLPLMLEICDRIGIMYAGKMAEIGRADRLLRGARHPYTQGLLRAFPSLTGPKVRIAGIPGSPPDLVSPPAGCRFQPRCAHAVAACSAAQPAMTAADAGGSVACHLYETEEAGHEPVAASRQR